LSFEEESGSFSTGAVACGEEGSLRAGEACTADEAAMVVEAVDQQLRGEVVGRVIREKVGKEAERRSFNR
jgi:hypothetical protein